MLPVDFVKKWKNVKLSESAAAQSHFGDLCRMLGFESPTDADHTGEWFTFQKGLSKATGGHGYADVWRKGCFAWEYKGKHKDLEKAYAQLQLYREALENPPLLVVCDMDRFEVHTNFNTVKAVYSFTLEDIVSDKPIAEHKLTAIAVLRALFEDPNRLKPGQTVDALTAEAADDMGRVAALLRKWNEINKITDHEIAKFVMRTVFCFFPTNVGLLKKESFTQLITVNRAQPDAFRKYLGQLFAAMKDGGEFLMHTVPQFNGGLFDDASVPILTTEQILLLEKLNRHNWEDIEPSIFGTLFERILDPTRRKQLGAHYTSREDIEILVDPVLMAPLRREWEEAKRQAEPYLDWRAAHGADRDFYRTKLLEILGRF